MYPLTQIRTFILSTSPGLAWFPKYHSITSFIFLLARWCHYTEFSNIYRSVDCTLIQSLVDKNLLVLFVAVTQWQIKSMMICNVLIKSSQIRHKVMIVNKNSNQSQALKLTW